MEISQSSKNYIAEQIIKGITFGELIEDDINPDNNGYWELEVN